MRRDDRVTINAWFAEHPFPGYLEPIKMIAREFEKSHPEYRVVVTGYDFREMPDAVRSAIALGKGPDIAEYYYTASQLARDTRAETGDPYFTSVQDAVGGRTEVLGEPAVDDLVPGIRDYYTVAGRLDSVPMVATTTLLFANRRLLDAAGVTGLPRTWEELADACGRIAAGTGALTHGVTWPDHGWIFQQALAVQGGLLADNDNGRSGRATTVNLASEQLLAFAHWWREMHRRGHYLYTGSPGDWEGCLSAFLDQRVAFVLHTSKVADLISEQATARGFDVEVGQLPHNGNAPYAGHLVSGQSLWLAGGLDRVREDGALAFLLYLVNPHNAAGWHKETGFVPVSEPAVRLLEEEGWFADRPQHLVAIEQLRQGDGSPAALGPMVGDLAGIQQCMTEAMEDVLLTGADPRLRFTEATVAAQQLLDDYNERSTGEGGRDQMPWKVA